MDPPHGRRWVAAALGALAVVVIGALVLVAESDQEATDSADTVATTAPSESANALGEAPAPDDLVLDGDGLGPITFGMPAEQAIEGLRAVLGEPRDDSLGPDPDLCPDRTVSWGWLRVSFSDSDGSPELQVSGWSLNNRGDAAGETGPDLSTSEGIRLGSTATEIESAAPQADAGSDGQSYVLRDIQIYLNTSSPSGVVEFLGAGFNGCVE